MNRFIPTTTTPPPLVVVVLLLLVVVVVVVAVVAAACYCRHNGTVKMHDVLRAWLVSQSMGPDLSFDPMTSQLCPTGPTKTRFS